MKRYLKLFLGLIAFAFSPSSGIAQARSEQTASAPSIQNMKKYEGYFNFYYDEKSGKIYLEVDKLDTEFLYFRSLSSGVGNGGPERGQAASAIAKFVKSGPKILLVEPVYNYRAISSNKDQIRAVENNFAKSVVFGFTPVSSSGGKHIIDLSPFIIRDSQGITSRLGIARVSGPVSSRSEASSGSYRLDESRSTIYMENTKNFPKNTEFESMLTFTGGNPNANPYGRGIDIAPDPTAITIHMHQSFVELPEAGYQPREFDPRSAFGQFSYMDFSAPMTEPIVKRFIRRHRLQKKNPGSAVSEPVKPIVYYVDRGAPEPIKKALIDGGAWWNDAFEAAGFKNAFQIKELPEDADPMDIRYNVVNWINRSGNPNRGFSSGASFLDPRTGEIIKGVVTLGSDRHRQDYLIAEGLLLPYESGKPVTDAMEKMALSRIRQLSAHEIGHTLGFNHNFAASPKGRASVMDYPYPRFSLKADGTVDISNAYGEGIGEWDKRAVAWGYSEFDKGTDEHAGLEKIMKETLAQGFIYIPDIGGNAHPTSHQWDDGENAIDQMTNILKVRRTILDRFSEKAIPDGQPMATIEEVLVPAYLLHRYQIEAVAKSVGGLYFTHAVKNDGQVVTRMVEPKEQWRAFESLMATISPYALSLPEKLIRMIPPRPSGYPASVESFKGYTGPTFDPISAAETAAATTLAYLLDAERATRLVEYNARDNQYPGFIEVADKLIERTWKTPLAAGYKGELQTVVNNQVLKGLIMLAANTKTSEIVRGQALYEIAELQQWMKTRLSNSAPRQKANMLFALAQIDDFRTNPNKFETPAPADMPPGAPIGMPSMDFLNGSALHSECSFNEM
ncbi:MAG: zinc-dependent metalloprotease [Arcticibacter sp.]